LLDGILVKTAFMNRNIFVQPISLFLSAEHNENQIIHLNLSEVTPAQNTLNEISSSIPSEIEEAIFFVTNDFSAFSKTKTGLIITSLMDELNMTAQKGRLTLNSEKKRELSGFMNRFQDCGLQILYKSQNQFINATPEETAAYLLRLINLGELYFQTERKTKIG
jgi:dsDNA-binding SOS-regulon protein